MNYFKYVLLSLVLSNFALAMDSNKPKFKGGSIQDLLDSKPNYQLCILGECALSSLPDSKNKFTSIKGIENIPDIEEMRRIQLDNNEISLEEDSLFVGKGYKWEIFNLDRNGIKSFNPAFFAGLNKLRILELKYNDIKEIKPEDLEALPTLERLELTGNPIPQDNRDELTRKFPNLSISF